MEVVKMVKEKRRVWIEGIGAGLKSPLGFGAVVEAEVEDGFVYLSREWMEKLGIYWAIDEKKLESGEWWQLSTKNKNKNKTLILEAVKDGEIIQYIVDDGGDYYLITPDLKDGVLIKKDKYSLLDIIDYLGRYGYKVTF